MFDYKQVLSLLFLFGTIVFTVYNWLLFRQQEANKQVVFKILYSFNGFILLHAVYGFITNLFFSEQLFFDLGDPFPLFYAPFYILILKAEVGYFKFIRKRVWMPHFAIGLAFFCVFALLVLNKQLYGTYMRLFIEVQYGVIGVQMIGYALWGMFLIQKNRVAGNRIKVWNLFLDGLLVLSITGAFYLASIHKVNELSTGIIKSNIYIVYLFMLLASIILHKVFNTSRFSKKNTVLKEQNEDELVAEDLALDEKYSKSRLGDNSLQQYAVKIESLKLTYFIKSDLNVEKLSADLKIPIHHLAQTFSIIFDSNYSQYVNKQRISYAIEILKEQVMTGDSTESISEISFRSGFNSDSSFYRAFKENCGMTPAQWKKREEAQQEVAE